MIAPQTLQKEGIRHRRWVKISHWIITAGFLLLSFSGFVILMCHPRLYWGETGNDLTPALFELPISRNYQHGGWENRVSFFGRPGSPVSASRTYDIFNQNGWGRSLHFLSGWLLVITGMVYLLAGFLTGHFRAHLWPGKNAFSSKLLWRDFVSHLRMRIPPPSSGPQYGILQKITYTMVVFFLLPLIILTGLTMAPAITASYPVLLKMFFGGQSARTIHFFASALLVLFVLVHIVMVIQSGFKQQVRAMTFGK